MKHDGTDLIAKEFWSPWRQFLPSSLVDFTVPRSRFYWIYHNSWDASCLEGLHIFRVFFDILCDHHNKLIFRPMLSQGVIQHEQAAKIGPVRQKSCIAPARVVAIGIAVDVGRAVDARTRNHNFSFKTASKQCYGCQVVQRRRVGQRRDVVLPLNLIMQNLKVPAGNFPFNADNFDEEGKRARQQGMRHSH